MRKFILLGVLIGIAFLGCEEPKYSWQLDDEEIRDYLKETGLDDIALKHDYGFYFIIEEEGSGARPTSSNYIEARTLGYYTDSVIFQPDIKVKGRLTEFYTGWQYGIPLLKKGGKGKLFLPRSMTDGVSVMIFDVELLNVW